MSIYTKEFAKRFALPEPEPGTEPQDGIQAVEFSVEEGPKGVPFYYCKLAVYLDNKLPIAYPEEGVGGSSRILTSHSHFFARLPEGNERWSKWSVDDRKHFSERQGRYTRTARLATPDYEWQKSGWSTDVFYDEYHRDLFPGLAYLKVDVGCANAIYFQKHATILLWLKRQGAKDYRHVLRTDPDDFLKSVIPRPFITKILPRLLAASEYNQKITDDENRRRRESLSRNNGKQRESSK